MNNILERMLEEQMEAHMHKGIQEMDRAQTEARRPTSEPPEPRDRPTPKSLKQTRKELEDKYGPKSAGYTHLPQINVDTPMPECKEPLTDYEKAKQKRQIKIEISIKSGIINHEVNWTLEKNENIELLKSISSGEAEFFINQYRALGGDNNE
ncbi:MAG: hypothetical protein DRH97_00225 [Chloroflexi bacterium]|nr:MAG: hypothetical protein DRH97_00225 [Chloroflexota bacterium]